MNFTKRTSFARYGKVKGAKGRARSPAVGDPASSPRLEPTAFWNDVPLFQPPTTAWPTLNTAAFPHRDETLHPVRNGPIYYCGVVDVISGATENLRGCIGVLDRPNLEGGCPTRGA